MSKKDKKSKPKITYIDDGRSLTDLSGTKKGSKERGEKKSYEQKRTRSTMGDKWKTYKQSVKMMFIPMLVTMAGICLIFLILYIVFSIPEWIA